jgi:hypothetical protein
MSIKITTPDYDEFYEFDSELDCKHFLISCIDDDTYHSTAYSINELLAQQNEYILYD